MRDGPGGADAPSLVGRFLSHGSAKGILAVIGQSGKISARFYDIDKPAKIAQGHSST